MSVANRDFQKMVAASGNSAPVAIALERGPDHISVYKASVFAEGTSGSEMNLTYIERLVKFLLWGRGGYRVYIAGCSKITRRLQHMYAPVSEREFDYNIMLRAFGKPLEILAVDFADMPKDNEYSSPVGRHLDGCRIGFDAGGSDRKVSAVVDGKAVYSEEVIWHPKESSDPSYQYNEIVTAMKTAASHLPRVDGIGVSTAGIVINNKLMSSSLFIKVPETLLATHVQNIFIDIANKEFGGVPIEVANDGDVTALAGAMSLDDTNVLGIAMGTSQACGYIDGGGNITGWLNELAFCPVDYNPGAMRDEWSGDIGCGVKYFSQDGVAKLAGFAGIEFPAGMTPAEKLKMIQDMHKDGDPRIDGIFESIGCYFGYAVALYADFYDIKHVLLMGRVVSGKGGDLIVKHAREALELEFPKLAATIRIQLPDEKSRRVGQSIAAASLPQINQNPARS